MKVGGTMHRFMLAAIFTFFVVVGTINAVELESVKETAAATARESVADHRSLATMSPSNVFGTNESNSENNQTEAPTTSDNAITIAADQLECVGTEGELRGALRNARGPIPVVVALCPGQTIEMASDIQIDDLMFELRCGLVDDTPATSTCTLSGKKKTRFFRGYPISAKFQDIVFRDGRAVNNFGGALSLFDGSIDFIRCKFTRNQAPFGAAVYVWGRTTNVRISDCVFESNTAIKSATGFAAYAGALEIQTGAHVTITNTILIFNQSTGKGGAIGLNAATLVMTDSIIADSTSDVGGALNSVRSDIVLMNVTFSSNIVADKVRDITIEDDEEPALQGTFVLCDRALLVNFCNGLTGIIESGGTKKINSNCKDDGLVQFASPQCLRS